MASWAGEPSTASREGSSEDEDSPGSGRTVAPGVTPLGEPGRELPMVVGAEERVEWAGENVVARGRQDAEVAGGVPGGEQRKAQAGDCEVVSPREEATTDSDGVLTEGRVALWRGGLGLGVVVGDEQGVVLPTKLSHFKLK